MSKVSDKKIRAMVDRAYLALLAHRAKGLNTPLVEIMRPILYEKGYGSLSAGERKRVYGEVQKGVLQRMRRPSIRPTNVATSQLPLF